MSKFATMDKIFKFWPKINTSIKTSVYQFLKKYQGQTRTIFFILANNRNLIENDFHQFIEKLQKFLGQLSNFGP